MPRVPRVLIDEIVISFHSIFISKYNYKNFFGLNPGMSCINYLSGTICIAIPLFESIFAG